MAFQRHISRCQRLDNKDGLKVWKITRAKEANIRHFRRETLSFDAASAPNPREYLHKSYLPRNYDL